MSGLTVVCRRPEGASGGRPEDLSGTWANDLRLARTIFQKYLVPVARRNLNGLPHSETCQHLQFRQGAR